VYTAGNGVDGPTLNIEEPANTGLRGHLGFACVGVPLPSPPHVKPFPLPLVQQSLPLLLLSPTASGPALRSVVASFLRP